MEDCTCLMAPVIQAYCIYNSFPTNSGIKVNIRQHSGFGYWAIARQRFKKMNMNPGEKVCCPWDVVNCNANSHDKNAEVTFVYDINYPTQKIHREFHQLINCPAGGAVSFSDNGPQQLPVQVFDPDSKPFPFKQEYTDMGWD
ncbi:hypothetical protein BCR43DRAFT_504198 [Syncephalastrum racemosum]|uniref:Uncharacterized protein n=1 Tax=Syncephalastrum racemosum TaxID=13706 RepID=A0A1X2HE45_SYNRA|nr:hypothetical protein BCR43DRAFT_504198 [Syncephalastrum racemosum]